MVVRKNNIWSKLDWLTVVIYLALIILGWINIYSAVFSEGQATNFSFDTKYGKQLIWIIASLVIAVLTLILDSKFYSSFAYLIYAITIITLIFVLFFGTRINGAKSWLVIGSMRIQPAEFAKFATTLALSKYFAKYNFNPKKLKTLLTFSLLVFLPSTLILLQNDTGTAIIFVVFFLVFYREGISGIYLIAALLAIILFILSLFFQNYELILFIEIVAFLAFYFLYRKIKWIVVGMGILATAHLLSWLIFSKIFEINNIYISTITSLVIVFLWFIFKIYQLKLQKTYILVVLFLGSIGYSYSINYIFNNILDKHQQHRINHLMGIESDPYGIGYNVNQSKIAIGSGGVIGKGYLQGTQTKFRFVPEQSTDFIFCTVGEEWGFFGTTFLNLLFLSLLLRLIFLAERQKSRFSRVFGYSVASILFFHIAVNIGMTIGLAPVIGIPLPFFSYGGSSLWGFTLLLFVFLKLDTSREQLLS